MKPDTTETCKTCQSWMPNGKTRCESRVGKCRQFNEFMSHNKKACKRHKPEEVHNEQAQAG